MNLQTNVRSALFVPGNRPDRFAKALASGADAVIVDFEDAVEEALKRQAHDHLSNFLAGHPDASVVVRINAADHRLHKQDVAFCAAQPGVAAILLAKAQTAAQVNAVAAAGKPVWPLIESAQGLFNLAAIAEVKGVKRLTFGALDLALELGMRTAGTAAQRIFDQVRYQLLLNSTLRGLHKPLDTVFAAIADGDGLRRFADDACSLGMGGMLAIHPSQVAVIHQAFAPSDQTLAWARRVVEAAVGAPGAFNLDGRMVDAPVIAEARRVLAMQTAADV